MPAKPKPAAAEPAVLADYRPVPGVAAAGGLDRPAGKADPGSDLP